jgi:hypothetical protein
MNVLSSKAIAAATVLTLTASLGSAQSVESSPEARAHIEHALQAFPATPDGSGLIDTAVADARVALLHAGLAASDLGDLNNMKLHVRHVLHAVDPEQVDGGPGSGYGAMKAAEEAAKHIELAAQAEGASEQVRTHASHIATSSRNAAERMERIASMAAEVEGVASPSVAAPLVQEIEELAGHAIAGLDADGDGRVTWRAGEGGLDTAVMHGGFVKKAEGME